MTLIACAENMFIVPELAVQCPPVVEIALHVASNNPAVVTVVAFETCPAVVKNRNGDSVAITTVPPLLDAVPTVSESALTAMIPPTPDDATVVAPALSNVVSVLLLPVNVPFPIPMNLNPFEFVVQLSEPPALVVWNAYPMIQSSPLLTTMLSAWMYDFMLPSESRRMYSTCPIIVPLSGLTEAVANGIAEKPFIELTEGLTMTAPSP